MRHILVAGTTCLIAGLTFMSCSGGGGGGGFVGTVVGASLKSAAPADLSGQQSVHTGKLGSGVTFTFPAVKGQDYLISVTTTKSDDTVDFEVVGDDGSPLNAKSVDSGKGFVYNHLGKSQHVLVLCRPYNPFSTDIQITKLTVTGIGNFADDKVHLNVYVCGKFDGYGAHNDLASAADRGAFTDQVMAKVRTLFQQAGINVTYEGFSFTADQLRQLDPNLLAPDDQAVCSAGEAMASTGFEVVQTQGLDAWGQLGFADTDPNPTRARGIDVFIVHHFTNEGTVGLSPRPGLIKGKGPDTAMAVATFLSANGTLQKRTPDQVATVLAHELGHFLGLLHTTTFDPSGVNPTEAIDDGLADTPKCTILADTNNDGRVGLGDGCQDEANIMFYMAGNQTIFSSGQAKIMRQVLSAQDH